MIAEWATGEFPHSTKDVASANLLDQRRTQPASDTLSAYQRPLFIGTSAGKMPTASYSNLRVNSSVESLNAYRKGVANPDWLGNLILRALPKK
jgi:hypothetical protein